MDEYDNRRWFENIMTFLTSTWTSIQKKLEVAPSPKYCTKCDTKISEGALFCSNCGAKVA
jgi:hypothetical protein